MRSTLTNKLVIMSITTMFALLNACSKTQPEGPGFVTSYATKNLEVDYYPYETPIPNSSNWHMESKTDLDQQWPWSMWGTEGGAPDPRGLPEWIEFKWREVPKKWDSLTFEEWKPRKDALPIKTYRVAVKNRIPQEVVDEIMESKRHRKKNHLPDKMLWLKFTWVGEEIKLGWRLTGRNARGGLDDLRSGGDVVE